MTTTTSGAVGFAPVGTFVNDLAKELGKSASTLSAYLKKHLPTTLSKRKNSNNRLANWVTSDGEAGLRAHYKPTYAPQPPSELELEVQRLRARVAELEAENASLKAGEKPPVKMSEVQFSFDSSKKKKPLEQMTLNELILEHDKIFKQIGQLYDLPNTKRRQRSTVASRSNNTNVIEFPGNSDKRS